MLNTYKRVQPPHIYHHIHMMPGHILLLTVCIFMLPVLGLVAEHVHLKTTPHMNPAEHFCPCHMTAPLVLPHLGNVLPVMVLHLNIGYTPHSSSYFSIHYVSPSPFLSVSGLWRMVVAVILLLLILSGDIETNPGPVGGKLSPDDLGRVMEEVLDVSAHWYLLGLQLGMRSGILDRIRAQFFDPRDQLLEMLKTWLCSSISPSWSTLVDALRSRSVGANQLAGILETKYSLLERTEVDSATPPSDSRPETTFIPPPPVSQLVVPKVTPQSRVADIQDTTSPTLQAAIVPCQHTTAQKGPDDVKVQVKNIEDKFGNLVKKTYQEVREIEPSDFLAEVTYLPVSYRHHHRTFIEEKLMDIPFPVTFIKIWSVLNLYWDFLNYGLLEHVVRNFGSEDLKRQMQDYVDNLSTFKRRTLLCDFDSWSRKNDGPDLRKVVVKMRQEWTQCTLQDVESFMEALIHKFFLPEFDIVLQKAERGCVCVTLLTSPSIATLLQQNLAYTETAFFTEHMIEAVTIDGLVCYPTSISGHPREEYTSETSMVGGIRHQMPAKKLHRAFKQEEEVKFKGRDFRSPHGRDSTTAAEMYAKQKCMDEFSGLSKLLSSAEQYLSKAEVEADPSLPTKYRDYLSSTPAIRAALCTRFSAKMSAEVFTWSQLTESHPPTTMTELFTTFTLKTLVEHLSTHSLYHKQQFKVTSFNELPQVLYKKFMDLCRMAYEGILNRQQLVFSATHLPAGFSPLGLMQEVPQKYAQGQASYHFTHLTLQEFLSAVHISQLPTDMQTKLIQELDSGYFKMTMKFVTGITKLAKIPPEVTSNLKKNRDNILILLYWLFESKDISVTTRTLGSERMEVKSHNSWTPLDYYVTGHIISHSNCPWTLNFNCFSFEKFELFCEGCATPRGTGCEGYISSATFSYSDITSKHMASFMTIPTHILQDMRVLHLGHNKLDVSVCDLLAKVVPSMSSLEVLSLSSNPIGSGGALKVIKSLCSSGVKQLWLNNTGIGEPDCETLSELLQSTHSLEWLCINNLSSESVANILTGLSNNNSLRILYISNSHFSQTNTLHLSSLLRKDSSCTIASLNLRDCNISSESAVDVATAICTNTRVRTLDLSGNPIGVHEEGMSAIAKSLIGNKSLTMLGLENCHISGHGACVLASALDKNTTLQYLNLDRNPIGVKGAASVSNMLERNTSLWRLYVCDDSLGEGGVRQLIDSVKHNQTLRGLYLPEKYKSETSDLRIHWL